MTQSLAMVLFAFAALGTQCSSSNIDGSCASGQCDNDSRIQDDVTMLQVSVQQHKQTSTKVNSSEIAVKTKVVYPQRGTYELANGDEFRLYYAKDVELVTYSGWNVGATYIITDITDTSLSISGGYGGGSATYTPTSITFANGQTATMVCAPWTEDACQQAAESLGFSLGGKGYDFADSSYGTKGCYTYGEKSAYKGIMFYGLGGTEYEKSKSSITPPKYRVPGAGCEACVPGSLGACIAAANNMGYKLGSGTVEFASFTYSTKGCYAYGTPDKDGYAYYGLGGSHYENLAPVDMPKVRFMGIDCDIKPVVKFQGH